MLKTILYRLKNPAIFLGVSSQIITMLLLFNVDVDRDTLTKAITAICTALTMLGVLSDPNSKGFKICDEYLYCSHCKKITCHISINDKKLCRECGTEFKSNK